MLRISPARVPTLEGVRRERDHLPDTASIAFELIPTTGGQRGDQPVGFPVGFHAQHGNTYQASGGKGTEVSKRVA